MAAGLAGILRDLRDLGRDDDGGWGWGSAKEGAVEGREESRVWGGGLMCTLCHLVARELAIAVGVQRGNRLGDGGESGGQGQLCVCVCARGCVCAWLSVCVGGRESQWGVIGDGERDG